MVERGGKRPGAGYKGDRKAASNLWTNVDDRDRVSRIT